MVNQHQKLEIFILSLLHFTSTGMDVQGSICNDSRIKKNILQNLH